MITHDDIAYSNALAFVTRLLIVNVENLRQHYILRYTVANSLTLLLSHISLDDMQLYAACNAPI